MDERFTPLIAVVIGLAAFFVGLFIVSGLYFAFESIMCAVFSACV